MIYLFTSADLTSVLAFLAFLLSFKHLVSIAIFLVRALLKSQKAPEHDPELVHFHFQRKPLLCWRFEDLDLKLLLKMRVFVCWFLILLCILVTGLVHCDVIDINIFSKPDLVIVDVKKVLIAHFWSRKILFFGGEEMQNSGIVWKWTLKGKRTLL